MKKIKHGIGGFKYVIDEEAERNDFVNLERLGVEIIDERDEHFIYLSTTKWSKKRYFKKDILDFERNIHMGSRIFPKEKPQYNGTRYYESEMLYKHYSNIFNQFAVDKKESK
jgi:hypothetical protein